MTKTVGKVLSEGTEEVKGLTGLDLNSILQAYAIKSVGTDAAAALNTASGAAHTAATSAKAAADAVL